MFLTPPARRRQEDDARVAVPAEGAAAHGHRLDTAPAPAIRFEPGIQRTVTLVALAGARVALGLTAEGGLA